jgi:hypothetical protein
MFFSGRWAYTTMMINWEKPGDSDPETVTAFIGIVKRAHENLVEGLSV